MRIKVVIQHEVGGYSIKVQLVDSGKDNGITLIDGSIGGVHALAGVEFLKTHGVWCTVVVNEHRGPTTGVGALDSVAGYHNFLLAVGP